MRKDGMTTKNEAKNINDAAEKSNPLGPDMWLHVATDSLRRFAEHCPVYVKEQPEGIIIFLPDIRLSDQRLHFGFVPLADQHPSVTKNI